MADHGFVSSFADSPMLRRTRSEETKWDHSFRDVHLLGDSKAHLGNVYHIEHHHNYYSQIPPFNHHGKTQSGLSTQSNIAWLALRC